MKNRIEAILIKEVLFLWQLQVLPTILLLLQNMIDIKIKLDGIIKDEIITKEENTYTAGELFGFGLSGLLKQIYKTDLYQIFSSTHVKNINIISLLLGLGISYRGTHEVLISNIISSYFSPVHFSRYV